MVSYPWCAHKDKDSKLIRRILIPRLKIPIVRLNPAGFYPIFVLYKKGDGMAFLIACAYKNKDSKVISEILSRDLKSRE